MENMMVGSGVVPVANIGNGYGYDGNWGGNWLWALLLFTMLGRGGWGNNYGGEMSALNGITNEFLYTNLNGTVDRGFTQVANQNIAIERAIQRAQDGLQMQIAQNGFNMQNCGCEINRNIDNVRYENAQNTCAITSNATANTQRILDKLCDMESNAKDQRINSLQLELQSATNQLSNLAQTASIVNQLRPTPIPAYTVCSPYQSYGNYGGCNGCC